MPKQAWIIAAILTGLLAFGAIGYSHWLMNEELNETRSALEREREAGRTNLTAMADAQLALQDQNSRISELTRRAEEMSHQRQELEAKMHENLESKDVTISELQGKLTVNILNRVLFGSGEVELKPSGKEVLAKVAELLADHPRQQIHVIGHTDNVPIRAQPWSRYPTNWELSTARATAAVRFLSEGAGIDPKRLGAVGYGEFRPIADNSTEEGRASNRRIAVVILSDELVGADLEPGPETLAPGGEPESLTTVQTNTPLEEESAVLVESTNTLEAPVTDDR